MEQMRDCRQHPWTASIWQHLTEPERDKCNKIFIILLFVVVTLSDNDDISPILKDVGETILEYRPGKAYGPFKLHKFIINPDPSFRSFYISLTNV